MLIHQQDYLIIDLEKSNRRYLYDNETHPDVYGYWVRLVFTAQVNGKLKKAELEIEVFSLDAYKKYFHQENTASSLDHAWMVKDFMPIYAVLDMLNSFGYSLKDNMFDSAYWGIIDKIITWVEEFWEEMMFDDKKTDGFYKTLKDQLETNS